MDLRNETLFSLSKAAREIPGAAVHAATIFRWCTKGVRGVILEAVWVGGQRKTSEEAIERFLNKLNAGSDGDTLSSQLTPAQREREVRRADEELIREGL